MKFSLIEHFNKLPLPATAKWPEGVWDTEAFSDGTMSLILFAPRGHDYQTSHDQDELYFVITGSGTLNIDGVPHKFETGDALFVPANIEHRFVSFTDDIQMWAVFWGQEGGEDS